MRWPAWIANRTSRVRLWLVTRTFYSRPLPREQRHMLNASQAKVRGLSLEAYQNAHVLIVGAGGLGSNVARALACRGAGRLTILDDDRVEVQNLTRQCYSKKDIGKNKAICNAKRTAQEAPFPLRIDARAKRFQEVADDNKFLSATLLWLILVDNDPTRTAAQRKALALERPCIFAGVSRDALSLYCAVYEPGQACLACMFPQIVANEGSYPCNVAGSIDIALAASSLVVFATDSILCGRRRGWNLRTLFLDGSMPQRCETVARNPDCALCSSIARNAASPDGQSRIDGVES